ncbi:MAG: undecaprenyldiphospho-muramoylpentapeptide beta-N-acetylglucosaminyltransferase [Bacillota bacterium]|nr:undecaprenyldiphospho-muramoylpentapeptide beta-N-acetylglucosaminyltransferase [Bacillota bacterium]
MKVLFAGGGTGGHINPALALAEYIKTREPYSDIRFAGASGGMEEKLVREEGYRLFTLPLHGIRRKPSLENIRYDAVSVYEAMTAVGKAKAIIREFKPDIIVGTGGYACFPVVYAGTRLKIPTVLLEVNAMPGAVVRMLSGRVSKVLVSFSDTIPYLKNRENAVLTGNPIRSKIVSADKKSAEKKLGIAGKPLVVTYWGSLGASGMNKKMIDFIRLEAEHYEFYHIHAAGAAGYKQMTEEISKLGIDLNGHKNIDLREYIHDMADVLAACDLVVCRAGASALAEICAVGRASLIVPSPYVADNHQEKNARALEKAGAATVLLENECTGESLYSEVKKLLNDPGKLNQMAQNALRLKKTDACPKIYEVLKNLLVS